MIKELIEKLRLRKVKLESLNEDGKKNINNIRLSKNNNIVKVDIDDYISMSEFVRKEKESQKYEDLKFLCNCVLWNSKKQMVNKGIYYIIILDNTIYNILITDEKILIDERINVELDETRQKENIIQEKLITFYEEKKEYTYYVAKHESNGNTYYTKYFNKNRGYSLGNLDLSDGEALVDLKEFLDNLERIESIEDIIDISLIKKVILDSFGEKSKVFLKP